MKPFKLEVAEPALSDLRERLKRTRFPDEAPGEAWKTGTSLAYLEDLLQYWRSGFDWRAQEARINSFQQFKVPLDGIELHFIHMPGKRPNATPLLLSHGWPGSIVEFLELIPRLTEHFTVVAPSLPGYTLSFAPGQKRFGVEEIAGTFVKLMTEVLGYRKFGLQGGDWGAFISSRIAATRPELVTGLHLNYLTVPRDKSDDPDWQAQLADWVKERSAYSIIQGTRPQTLAYGLTVSPVGQLAWVMDKFREWTHPRSALPEQVVDRDRLLTNVMLYWLTRTAGSAAYVGYAQEAAWGAAKKSSGVPTAAVVFAHDVGIRRYAEQENTITRWTDVDHGGHFAALEEPETLAEDVREFFSPLR
jgi:epoxide hydrolase